MGARSSLDAKLGALPAPLLPRKTMARDPSRSAGAAHRAALLARISAGGAKFSPEPSSNFGTSFRRTLAPDTVLHALPGATHLKRPPEAISTRAPNICLPACLTKSHPVPKEQATLLQGPTSRLHPGRAAAAGLGMRRIAAGSRAAARMWRPMATKPASTRGTSCERCVVGKPGRSPARQGPWLPSLSEERIRQRYW